MWQSRDSHPGLMDSKTTFFLIDFMFHLVIEQTHITLGPLLKFGFPSWMVDNLCPQRIMVLGISETNLFRVQFPLSRELLGQRALDSGMFNGWWLPIMWCLWLPILFLIQPFTWDLGFSGGSEGKASACKARDLGSIPGWGRSPGEGNGNPLQYSCLENPVDWGV